MPPSIAFTPRAREVERGPPRAWRRAPHRATYNDGVRSAGLDMVREPRADRKRGARNVAGAVLEAGRIEHQRLLRSRSTHGKRRASRRIDRNSACVASQPRRSPRRRLPPSHFAAAMKRSGLRARRGRRTSAMRAPLHRRVECPCLHQFDRRALIIEPRQVPAAYSAGERTSKDMWFSNFVLEGFQSAGEIRRIPNRLATLSRPIAFPEKDRKGSAPYAIARAPVPGPQGASPWCRS